jgi:hypothetical protein
MLFERLSGFRVGLADFLIACNADRPEGHKRIEVLPNGKWWLTGFIEDQYGRDLNRGGNSFKGVEKSLVANKCPYKSYGYNLGVTQGLTESDQGLPKGYPTDTDTDTDTDTCIASSGVASDLALALDPALKARKKRDLPLDFEAFWKAYPRKTAKTKALESWLRKKPPIEKCLFTLQWQVSSFDWTKEDGKYIPNPATWLNQGRWDDEPPQSTAPEARGKELWPPSQTK